MIVTDIKGRVRTNLDDAGVTFYTDVDITDSIQETYNEVVILTESMECMREISFQDSLVYYDLSALIPDYFRPLAIYNKNNKRWLDFKDISYVQQIRHDWELAQGQPEIFMLMDFRYIALFPRLETASGSMEIFYKAKANVLRDTSVPVLPDGNTIVLEEGATADLLEQKEEFTKAGMYFSNYMDKIYKIRTHVNMRPFPDRVSEMREAFYGVQL